MDTEKFLIHGIIFQDRQYFIETGIDGININTSDGTGIVKALFHGIVTLEKKEAARYGICGECNDRWGKSNISNVILLGSSLSFYKTYERRPPIEYQFKQQPDGVWHGIYKGHEERISGTAKCYLQPITDDFFALNV